MVRSAQTPAGAVAGSGRSTGPGESLTARGRTQAARAADLVFRLGRSAWADLTRPSVLVAAPTARSQETALAVGRRLGLSVTTDERLGPSSPDGGEEVRAVLEDLVRTHLVDAPTGSTGPADRGAVVVADAVQVRAAIGVAVQAAPARWSLLRVPPGSVSILRLWGDGTTELVAAGVPGDL
nr:histidine phosphatase family protein [Cellulosimicrobium arenosum]